MNKIHHNCDTDIYQDVVLEKYSTPATWKLCVHLLECDFGQNMSDQNIPNVWFPIWLAKRVPVRIIGLGLQTISALPFGISERLFSVLLVVDCENMSGTTYAVNSNNIFQTSSQNPRQIH